ncbi:TetR/AcrR family transcriptional regulator C-terminal domain-containing protein [Nocardia sp. NBC_01503]|uniref:TetR/AcrR family transcriptional regulator C-terminal domain-containing protein n=1 Tax=Nocardia sp. NBC_01503 TaxID=2975997 RepID=UPI002E7BB55B|nr:TetR/AcrR family transcriptional regulator C-terminal domain-containing protein [Nocardia sp. NBC_01503]WTL30800.1 TetR/AcrR family transcriptional regulator C-terminal domain-containing protein [Nocardia sp. NBC_01503]
MTDAATPARPRRGRPPKTEAQLSRAAIQRAALSVIDTEGIAAVSMRSVSRMLGVDAKSLYHHIEGKDDLLDAVAEHILGQLHIPAPTDSLDGDLRALAHEFRRVTLAHPEAAMLVLTRQLSSPVGLTPTEAILALLHRAGIAPEQAVHLLRTLLATLVGTLLREVSAGPTFGTADPAEIAERQRALQDSGLPTLVPAAPYLAHFDRDQEFEYTLDLIVRIVTSYGA